MRSEKQVATSVVNKLQTAGFEAYLAGGCVRDMLLGKDPKDYDITTSAKPEQIEKLFNKTVDIGKEFGTIIVIEQGQSIDVTTFRAEGPYSDNRRPDFIKFTTAEEDASRRDFTINALFFDPFKNKLIDFVGGEDDVKRRTIRFVGNPNERIHEDHLRILRAIRFKTSLGFSYVDDTRLAIKSKIGLVANVAVERLRDELNSIFSSSNRHIGFVELSEFGAFDILLPEIEAQKGVPQPIEYHHEGDVFTHIYLCLKSLPSDAPLYLVWATLLHDIAKPQTLTRKNGRILFHDHAQISAEIARAILKRLKFPNFEIEIIAWLIHNHMKIGDIEKMRPFKRMGFLLDQRFPSLLELARADSFGTYPINTSLVEQMEKKLSDAISRRDESLKIKKGNLINGDDLIAAGLAPSEKFGEILEDANDYSILNKVPKAATLLYIKTKYQI